MLRKLSETITDRIRPNDRMMQVSGEGVAHNHDAVHAKLERELFRHHLSSQNPRGALMWEQRPVNNHAGGLEHQGLSQDASQVSQLSFDYNQGLFAQPRQMLDSYPVSQGNSH